MATARDVINQWPGLHTLDLGSVISPDGRDTPLVPTTPVIMSPTSAPASDPGKGQPLDGPTTDPKSSAWFPSLPEHFGARVAVGIIAVVVILIVIVRMLAPAAPAVAALA